MHERQRARRHAGHRDGDPERGTPAVGKLTLVELLGEGEALPERQRARFEQSLGQDLSAVRIHHDHHAARFVDLLGGRAATVGGHIAFAAGQYDPDSAEGEHLLAHEVAHAAQQGQVAPSARIESLLATRPGDPTEVDADGAARAMVAGLPAKVTAAPVAVARMAKEEPVRPAAEDEIGELTADRVGQEEDHDGDAPLEAPRDPEAAKRDLVAPAPEPASEGEPPAAAPESVATTTGAADGIAEAQAEAREAASQAEAEAAAFKTEMQVAREKFEADQQATSLDHLKAMSATDKRATLAELGYDPKYIQKLKDSDLDGLISGKLEAEQRKTTILGMTPDELATLPAARKLQYLVDLGIDRADLDKAGTAKCERLFADIMRAAHVPGTHKVKIQIKGGLFGKSWLVTVKCDAAGGVDVQAQKEGGFLSKLVGWIKAALPIILTVIAPLTGGASLIALSVYQTMMAIKSGDWLGAITGAASALVGIGAIKAVAQGTSGLAQAFSKIAGVADKVKTLAESARLAMIAAKAKNPGSLLGALAAGAATFATFASNAASKFAQNMTRWSQRLTRASQIVSGGQKVVAGIKDGDAIAAIGGALDTAGAVAGGGTAKQLQRASNIATHVNAGRKALQSDPPDYAAVANAAFGIATQLEDDRRVEDARRIVASATRLKQAWDQRAANPAALAEAALGLAESIQLAKYDLEHDEQHDADGKPIDDAARTAIVARYQRATKVAHHAGAALVAVTAKPPNFAAAADAATQLAAELTSDQRVDAAAVVTSRLEAWRQALRSGDDQQIFDAGCALGQAIDGMRTSIQDARTEARREAEAQLPPGEQLPDDGGPLPPGPDPAERPAPTGAPMPSDGSVTRPDDTVLSGASTTSSSSSSSTTVPATAPGTPTPATTAPAPLPADVSSIIAVINVFADLASEFDHPLAKQLIGEWGNLVEQTEQLRKAGESSAYTTALAGLRFLRSSTAFVELVAKELATWDGKLHPHDVAANRGQLQSFGRLTRNLGRLARVAAIPEAFVTAADDLVVACGYDKSLTGEPATTAERLVAAANLVKRAATLHPELVWAVRLGQAVVTKLGAGSVLAAINTVRVAAAKYGDDVARVVVRWLRPVLEKVGAAEGAAAATRLAEKLALEIATWGASLSRVTSSKLFRVAANTLGKRLGLVLRFGVSGPVAIALEIGQLELQIADELFREAYASISHVLSAQLFGKNVDQLKREIQSKPIASESACNALFRYAFQSMLGGAASRVRAAWPPFIVQLPNRIGKEITGPAFHQQFSSQPVQALERLDPPDIKLLVADVLKAMAIEFIDQEYRREFGEDP